MAQRDRKGLRVVEADRPSAEDILRMSVPTPKPNRLEFWLSQQEAATNALFWETMRLAKDRGRNIGPVYQTFMEQFADGQPPMGIRQAVDLVNAKLKANG